MHISSVVFPASRGLLSGVFTELTDMRKRDLCPASKWQLNESAGQRSLLLVPVSSANTTEKRPLLAGNSSVEL